MDSSLLFEADQASGQPSQIEYNIIGMEPVYYNAAAKGDIGGFKNIPKPLNQLLTPNRNTVYQDHSKQKTQESTRIAEVQEMISEALAV